MKLIKSVEVIDIPEDCTKVRTVPYPHLTEFALKHKIATEEEVAKIHSETVRGQRFVNANGEEVIIGMSKDVQELIGLPFECFNMNAHNEIENLKKDLKQSDEYAVRQAKQLANQLFFREQFEKRIEDVCSLGIWGRIKFVFTGEF